MEIMRNLKTFSTERDMIDFDYVTTKLSDGHQFGITFKSGGYEIYIQEKYILLKTKQPTFNEMEERFFENLIRRLIKVGIKSTIETSAEKLEKS